jgi:HD-GYP domain-containing protein (c-di-GMP phosphodiesterase class II)
MNRVMEREVTDRRKAEQKIGEQLERQRALTAVESAITSSLDLSLTLNVFIEQVMSQLRTDAAAVLLYDPELQELTFAAERGFRSNRIKKVTVRAGQSLAGRVISLRENIIVPDFDREDSRYPMPEGYSFKNAFMVRDEGFRSYIGVPLIVKGQVKGIIEIFQRRPFDPPGDWREFLEALSRQAAIAIDNASMFEQLQRAHGEIVHAYDMTIEGWSRALDIRDNETHGHSQRVAAMTIMTAEILGISGKELVNVRRGALLHDIGKLGVPDSILLKPGKLTDEEMSVMKRHPTIAYEILSPIPFLREALDIPYLHHEKWDGSGYPKGMLGEAIPVPSRIFAVIDVWDALRSDRPYRPAWSEERIVEYLKAEKGKHFDPAIVDVFLAKVLPGAFS